MSEFKQTFEKKLKVCYFHLRLNFQCSKKIKNTTDAILSSGLKIDQKNQITQDKEGFK